MQFSMIPTEDCLTLNHNHFSFITFSFIHYKLYYIIIEVTTDLMQTHISTTHCSFTRQLNPIHTTGAVASQATVLNHQF